MGLNRLAHSRTDRDLSTTGMSSRPSAECLYSVPFLSSGAILSRASLMSSRTSLSQFSFNDRAHDVCCTKRLSSPTLYSLSSGRALTTSSVIRYEPRDLEGSVNVFWNQAISETFAEHPIGQVTIGRVGADVSEGNRNRKGRATRY